MAEEESLFKKFDRICKLVTGDDSRPPDPTDEIAIENLFLREVYGKSAQECTAEEFEKAYSALAITAMEELGIRSIIPRSLPAVAEAIARQRATKH